MRTVPDIIDELRHLDLEALRRASDRAMAGLNLRQRKYVEEYTKDFNSSRAKKAAGLGKVRTPEIVEAVAVRVAEQSAKSDLDAEYVRQYIKSVLDFCPLDFFEPAEGGGWLMSEENYRNMPQSAKCLIEDVEYRKIRGDVFMAVKFLSKTAALAMAARYTLTQKFESQIATIPWDEVSRRLEQETHDPIAKRLADLDQQIASKRS
jgi:hypothetical protein